MFTIVAVATTAPTDASRLEIARAQLKVLGPSAYDMTAAQMARRRELEEKIRRLEALVAEQVALPLDDEPDPLDVLRWPVDFTDDDVEPWDGRLRLVR